MELQIMQSLSHLDTTNNCDQFINQKMNTSYLLMQGVRKTELISILRYIDVLDKEIIGSCINRFWLTKSGNSLLVLCYYLTRMPIAFKERWVLHKPFDKTNFKNFVLEYQKSMPGEEFIIYGNVTDGLSRVIDTIYA